MRVRSHELRIPDKVAEVRTRQLECEIDVVATQLGFGRIRIRDQFDGDLIEFRSTEKVLRISYEDDLLAAEPPGELERTGPDRACVKGKRVEIRILRKQMLGKDERRRIALAEERFDRRREDGLHVEDDGCVVRRRDRCDLIEAVTRDHVVIRIHHRMPRERDVLAREPDAVVPLHVGAQMVGDRLAVFRYSTIR